MSGNCGQLRGGVAIQTSRRAILPRSRPPLGVRSVAGRLMAQTVPPHSAALTLAGGIPDAPGGAELVQIHGSYVLLGRECVCKLKKSLDSDFAQLLCPI